MIHPLGKCSAKMLSRMNLYVCLSVFLCGSICLFCAMPASAQDWFKTGTGLGVSKVRLAVPEFGLRAPAPPPLEKTFHDVLWSDLEYCGILDLVSPSFYPPQSPSQPSELKFADWASAPSSACHDRS